MTACLLSYNLPAVRRRMALIGALLLGLVVAAPTAKAFSPLLLAGVESSIEQGDTDAAGVILRRALEETGDPRIREDLLARLAEIHRDAGDYRTAGDIFLELADALAMRLGHFAPERLVPLEEAANAYENEGGAAEAAGVIREILAILAAGAQAAEIPAWIGRLDALAADADPVTLALIRDLIAQAQSEMARTRSAPAGGDGYTMVRIYYGTDRARSGDDSPSKFYSGERGELEMGTALVSVPASHRPGQLERPSIWSFDVRLDPERHIVLQQVEPAPPGAVFEKMREHVRATGAREAFVFVHGFNVTFSDAARRTAQMAYDMNFGGLPILYSWPSRGSVLSYISDTAVVNLSGRRLSMFLERVVAQSGAERIHLVAHSMGNRALTDALELFALRNRGSEAAFDQILFTAPDLDAGLFAEMARTIRPVAKRLTLYTSDKDWALAVSRRLHGDAPRAGQGGEGILVSPVFDTVDMTMIGEDMLAHSYFANNASALTDIFSLFWRDAPPEQRCGMKLRQASDGTAYWSYSPEECDGDALLATLAILKRSSIGSIADARDFFIQYIGSGSLDPLERSRLLKALNRLLGG